MTYNIDQLIAQTSTMPNVSKGGSACYAFGEVVLVKYEMSTRYGLVRPDAEIVAEMVNSKNKNGVRTPKHLAIKREIVGEKGICWVLQETAKGKCYLDYCRNPDNNQQLENQAIIANAPDSHYEQMALDLKSLLYVGLEIKPKNIFYDESIENGGFTFIDFICPKDREYDGGLVDSLSIMKLMFNVVHYSGISTYGDDATEEEKERFYKLRNLQYLKCFKALEKTIPEIQQHRRWMLRTLDADVLTYFEENGVEVGDLTLTEQEEVKFMQHVNKIAADSVEMIASGEYEYWQITVNEVRNSIYFYKLAESYQYSKNCKFKKQDYESVWDFESAISHYLEQYTIEKVDELIEKAVLEGSDCNEYLTNAYNDLQARKNTI